MSRLVGLLFALGVMASANAVAAPPAGTLSLPKGAIVTQSREVLLATTPTRQRAYGFSHRTGEVNVVRIDAQGKESVLPVVGDSVGCFTVGTKAYAFGAETGTWAVVDLEAAAQPVVSADLVRIDVGSRIYLFSSRSKAWQVIDLSVDEE
jgi:hypothetical protein